jgi:O-antigen/teichoic acid export membrane protein
MRESQRSIAKDVWGILLIQGASAALIFLSGLFLAHILDPLAFGAYDYIDVWVEILMFFALLGFDRLLIVKIPVYSLNQENGLIRGIIRLAHIVSIALSIAIGLGFCAVAYLYFSNYGLQIGLNPTELSLRLSILPFLTVLLVLRVIIKLNQVILQGFKKPVPAYIPDYVLRPLLLIVIAASFWYLNVFNTQQALFAHILAASIALMLSLYLNKQLAQASVNDKNIKYLNKEWLKSAVPFTLISALTLLNLRGGSAILGSFTDFETSALYGVSVRLTALIALALAATSAVTAPRIAALFAEGKHQELQKLVSFSTRMICLVALPAILLLMFGGKFILGFFGETYPQAYTALVILSMSQIVNVATGVVGWIVMMTGHERVMAVILTISAAIHILGMLFLSPIFGLEGAALATALSNAFTNIALSVFSYRHLKINPTIF